MSKAEQHNRFDYIEFPVTSPEALARTRDFFSSVFGWEYQAWGDSYADTDSSGVSSGINAHSAEAPPRPLPVVYVSHLEDLLDRVRKAGAEITQPIFSFPGGRRFHFKEPSGNEMAAYTDQPAPEAT